MYINCFYCTREVLFDLGYPVRNKNFITTKCCLWCKRSDMKRHKFNKLTRKWINPNPKIYEYLNKPKRLKQITVKEKQKITKRYSSTKFNGSLKDGFPFEEPALSEDILDFLPELSTY